MIYCAVSDITDPQQEFNLETLQDSYIVTVESARQMLKILLYII